MTFGFDLLKCLAAGISSANFKLPLMHTELAPLKRTKLLYRLCTGGTGAVNRGAMHSTQQAGRPEASAAVGLTSLEREPRPTHRAASKAVQPPRHRGQGSGAHNPGQL